MNDDGGPAFPALGEHPSAKGMSLRDWFAGQALLGELSSQSEGVGEYPARCWPALAKASYEIADAMLAARKEAEGE